MAKNGLYYRFNVPGMGDIGLEEYKRIPRVASETIAYLQSAEVGLRMKYCIEMLLKTQSKGS